MLSLHCNYIVTQLMNFQNLFKSLSWTRKYIRLYINEDFSNRLQSLLLVKFRSINYLLDFNMKQLEVMEC